MAVKDFILDGGLFGLMRGFDHEEEGRAYGFGEFMEDTSAAREVIASVFSVAGGGNYLKGPDPGYLEED